MFTFEIKARITGVGLFTCELAAKYESSLPPKQLGEAVKKAVKAKANLRSADLRSANLRSADLHGADLRSADLHGAGVVNTILDPAHLAKTFGVDWFERYNAALAYAKESAP